MRLVLGIAAFLAGWYVGPEPQDHGDMQLWMTPECITKLEVTPKTICHGPDLHHLTCTGFVLHYKENCEHWAPAANDGVLGPFSRCQQQYEADAAPMKTASLSQSGEAELFSNPEDPFGIDQEQ